MSDEACPAFAESQSNIKKMIDDAQGKIKDGTLKKQNLIWLELTGCSGNIISLLDGANPGFEYLLTQMTNIIFDNTLMKAQGDAAMEKLFSLPTGDFILAVEGAVSTAADGRYCYYWQDERGRNYRP